MDIKIYNRNNRYSNVIIWLIDVFENRIDMSDISYKVLPVDKISHHILVYFSHYHDLFTNL